MESTLPLPYTGSFSSKLNYKIALFSVAVGLSVFLRSAYLSFTLFTLLIVWDRRFIIPALLITPSIETVLVATEGLTITKLLAGFLAIYLSLFIITKKRNLWDRNCNLLLIFIVIVILGSLIPLYHPPLIDFDTSVSFFIKTGLPKILFVIIILLYLKQKGKSYYIESLHISLYTISISLIIILAYFIFFEYDSITWRIATTRLTFKGADPNEFAGIISSLSVFTLGMLYITRHKKFIILGFIATGLLIYSVILTMSRGGVLTLLFLFFLNTIL